jgi:hypothetical protein
VIDTQLNPNLWRSLWMVSMKPYIKIATLENIMEAQQLESILAEKDIPYRLRSFHDTAYDGLFQFQKGWGELFAPAAFRDEIIEIVEDLRSA